MFALLVAAAATSAQDSSPKVSVAAEALPLSTKAAEPIPVEGDRGLFANAGWDAGAAGTTGPRGFSNFIGFLGNPLQNIDPRAITEI
jgi:hypothetical protein